MENKNTSKNRAIQFYEKKMVKNSLKIWIEFLRAKKTVENQDKQAENFNLRHLCGPVFEKWKTVRECFLLVLHEKPNNI